MHFETKKDYTAWALVMFLAQGDKNNSNALGNALDHAKKCADLMYPEHQMQQTGVQSLPMQQPPMTPTVNTAMPGKAPPVPGERTVVPNGPTG